MESPPQPIKLFLKLSDYLVQTYIIVDWMPPHRGAGQAPQVRHDENQSGFFVIPAKAGIQNACHSVPAKIVQFRFSKSYFKT